MNLPTIDTPRGPIPAASPAWNRQRASQMPAHRYRDVHSRVEVPLTERIWPTRTLTAAPLWVPVDLRDGNQALPEPMDPARKRRFFELMIAMGYKEIEVGYPSASQTDFDFVRQIADHGIAPDDVTVVVFTPARRDLIERTVESIRGITNEVVIHMYTATAPTWREVVLGRDREELRGLILDGARDLLSAAGDLANVRFEFSPEVFNLTEPDYVLQVCDAVTSVWDASAERPVILNLPATVEVATPNVYADQIEYMDRNLARRESVILSVHPHNDRGTGIACAELAVLAGAQRVEGCLFGNGERTGNVDLATLALNLFARGIDPMVDFSDIDEVRRTVEACNGIDVHSRHPYAGDLVHTAFSGTHQDAIKKGFEEHRARASSEGRSEREIEWCVPYLPVDPADIGRTYDAVIRVNSQSGKGGMAYLLERELGIELPRRVQIEFARHVQAYADEHGAEIGADALWSLFQDAFGSRPGRFELVECAAQETAEGSRVTVGLEVDGATHRTVAEGVGPVEAMVAALADHDVKVDVLSLHQTSLGHGDDAEALTLLEHRRDGEVRWTMGRHRSVLAATAAAVLAAAGSK